MDAVRIEENGGADVLGLVNIPHPEPTSGDVVVRVAAAGLNFIDVYHREGRYPVELPFVPGVEGAGVVEAVAAGVDDLAPGDRVAWVMHPGAYAELALVPRDRLVRVPEQIDLRTAAAVMLQGLTAHYLTTSVFPVGPEHTVLVHAAAGGVGRLLVQMNAAAGARVIATASTDEKLQLAAGDGATGLIRYSDEDFVAQTLAFTDGEGVDVVFDGVGRATFRGGLEVLRPRGMMALFGAASGPVEPIDPMELSAHGSLFLTRASLGDYVATLEELRQRTDDLWEQLRAGHLHVHVDNSFPLGEAADAHRYIEGRQTKGKVLLLP